MIAAPGIQVPYSKIARRRPSATLKALRARYFVLRKKC